VEAQEIVTKYKIGWIFVSDVERMRHIVDETGLQKLGKIVWNEGRNYLIKVD
jgi:uncharacterized membrane protein